MVIIDIILNERKKAEEILSSASTTENPIKNVFLLSKYYYAQGMKQSEVLHTIEEYLMQFPFIVLPKWQSTIEKMVAKAKKQNLIEIDGVVVTQTEMETINGLRKESLRKLAFTLLCLAKFYDKVNPNNQGWANTPDKDVFRMANINSLDSRRQQALINELYMLGMVGYSKVIDNINLKVIFIDQYPDVIATITDFNDLGLQYLKLTGDKCIVQCKDCGKLLKKKSKRLDYCSNCAKIHIKESNKQSVKRYRK